ncbi:MAG: aminotransferase class III-fold pyridoxal phosphate-dependent enzyme [Actinomycetota bacterium]|nr:aminotransferase class III-fold pyridoxal phosphate-dependent enzyme [Actinomycetota bacterium]
MGRDQSEQLFERARRRAPGGVHSNVRLSGPPIFFSHGEGAWLWDVDGHDYVDYLLGQGPAFLGHAPPQVLQAVERASRRGLVFGAQHPLEVEAAERLCAMLGWAEMVRFGSSGTEMVQAALRLARAATGRRRFVRFEGHYHGWLDNLLISLEGQPGPASAGQLPEALDEGLVLPWNDLQAVEEVLGREGEQVAAVLMEPMMVNAGAILPRPGYLEGVRELCDRHDVVLIFDEIITGFRLGPGGAAERFGVSPDLATFGKALAGGWPVAALAGRGELMERLGTGEVNHSGTFNANAMGMAAVEASLRLLAERPPYGEIERVGREVMEGLERLGREAGLPLRLQGLPMAFHASFGEDVEVTDFAGLQALDAARYRKLADLLVDEGVWVAGRGVWYVSAAHGDREVEATLERGQRALERL